MAIYRPSKSKKKAIEDVLRDLDPATRELARTVLENILREEALEVSVEELRKYVESIKKKQLTQ
ncbi:MAG: hypothetical protein QXH02_00430 [Desulfurococcaceae archaeon]